MVTRSGKKSRLIDIEGYDGEMWDKSYGIKLNMNEIKHQRKLGLKRSTYK